MPPKAKMNVGELFADFNDRFFDGRLPLYTIELMPVDWHETTGLDGECNITWGTIKLNVDLLEDEEALREVLIHEMAHAVTDDLDTDADFLEHDRKFLAELLRLLRAGAPVNPLEFDEYGGEGWTGADLTEAEKSGAASEGKETVCVYCGERVTVPTSSSGLTRHWTMCPSAPGFVRGEAKTTLKALVPPVRWVSPEEWNVRHGQEKRRSEEEKQRERDWQEQERRWAALSDAERANRTAAAEAKVLRQNQNAHGRLLAQFALENPQVLRRWAEAQAKKALLAEGER